VSDISVYTASVTAHERRRETKVMSILSNSAFYPQRDGKWVDAKVSLHGAYILPTLVYGLEA